MDLKELESGVDPEKHWYYQSKKIPLVQFLKSKFLLRKKPLTLIDVGSGSGFFMYELIKDNPEMIEKIWLVDTGYTQQEILMTKNQLIEKSLSLPSKINDAVVVMMDVLEHLISDAEMLESIKKKCVGENYFFITVPAFMNLWSGHDIYLGHYRRYVKNSLNNLLRDSLYRTEKIYYIYGMIFPLVWMSRKLESKNAIPQSDMKRINSWANTLLTRICSFEMHFRKLNKFAGVTCVAEGKIDQSN
ncbi:MAG: hypothetical protein H0W62_11440 [Chitinophagales bacterium]|nr:hypothetical protein [Chitinophagales bacterium]